MINHKRYWIQGGTDVHYIKILEKNKNDEKNYLYFTITTKPQ